MSRIPRYFACKILLLLFFGMPSTLKRSTAVLVNLPILFNSLARTPWYTRAALLSKGSNAFTNDDMVAVYQQSGLIVVEMIIRVDQSAPASLMSLFSLNITEQRASVRFIGLNCRDLFSSFFPRVL